MGNEAVHISIIDASGRYPRTVKFGDTWVIHKDAVKLKDGRKVPGTV